MKTSLANLHPLHFRRDRPTDPVLVEKIEHQVKTFVDSGPLDKAALILDGPGVGCSSELLVLGLLGRKRLFDFNEVHCFSAAGYVMLYYLAKQEGQFSFDPSDVEKLNRENQIRHRIVRGKTLLGGLARKLKGEAYLFPNELLELATTANLTEEFCQRKVKDLPPSLNFWTFNTTKKRLCSIYSGSEFDDLTLGEVMRPTASVPHLYEPFHYRGCEYIDAIFAPNLKPLLRQIRNENERTLFCHMIRDGQYGNTTYLKLHNDVHGYVRVIVDFMYFVLGIENQEFIDGIRLGLMETVPLPFTNLSAEQSLLPARKFA